MNKLVYPHRSFTRSGGCDACSKKGTTFHNVDKNPHIGLMSCDDCTEEVKKYLQYTTIKAADLQKTLDQSIHIRRSSGRMESYWVIYGDAFQETKDGPFWVQVRNRMYTLSKIVKLSDINKWNTQLLKA